MPATVYTPENFLEECRDYQAALAEMQDPAAQDMLGKEFGALLFGRANYLGEKRIVIGGEDTFVPLRTGNFNQIAGKTGPPKLPALEFDDIVVAKGRLGNPEYAWSRRRGGTIALTLYDAQVIRVDELILDLLDADDELARDPTLLNNRMPDSRSLRLPILFPVDAVNLVMCASGREPYRHSSHVAQNEYYPLQLPAGFTQGVS